MKNVTNNSLCATKPFKRLHKLEVAVACRKIIIEIQSEKEIIKTKKIENFMKYVNLFRWIIRKESISKKEARDKWERRHPNFFLSFGREQQKLEAIRLLKETKKTSCRYIYLSFSEFYLLYPYVKK